MKSLTDWERVFIIHTLELSNEEDLKFLETCLDEQTKEFKADRIITRQSIIEKLKNWYN